MRKTYEMWEEFKEGISIHFLQKGGAQALQKKRMLDPSATLKLRVQADTYEEALALFYMKLGWAPYVPNGDPAPCPNGCGGVFCQYRLKIPHSAGRKVVHFQAEAVYSFSRRVENGTGW